MNKKYISLTNIKIILQNIVNKEFVDWHDSINCYIYTNNKHINKSIDGQYSSQNGVEIFIDNFFYSQGLKDIFLYKRFGLINMDIFVKVLETTFHECFHGLINMQLATFIDELDLFIILSEIGLLNLDYEYYDQKHDLFYSEILADLYGNIKTREFLEINYPDIYCSHQKKLNDELERIKKRVVFYDFNLIYQKHYQDFIHEDGKDKFISIKAIYDMYKLCDERIVYSILTLDLFLEQLDINNLSSEEITILELAIDYAYSKELLKKDYIDNNFILDNLSMEDANYYKDNIKKIKYFEEITRKINDTKKKNILKKKKC